MNEIFDIKYVESPRTIPVPGEESEEKKFLESPIKQDDIRKYGLSKPYRVIITAKITQNDKS